MPNGPQEALKRTRGKIVVFHLCKKGTLEPNPDAVHGAMPVIQGEKWAFNLWFREKEVSKRP